MPRAVTGTKVNLMAVQDSMELPRGGSQLKKKGKAPRKSWVAAFGRIFWSKHLKSLSNPLEEGEQMVEERPEISDRDSDRSNLAINVAHCKKKPVMEVCSRTWSPTTDAHVSYETDYYGQHEEKLNTKSLEDEMGDYRITGLRSSLNTTGAAFKSSQLDNHPPTRKPSNIQTMFFQGHNFTFEAEAIDGEEKRKATDYESISGCLPSLNTSSKKQSEEAIRGRIGYSKAGGNEDDTLSFDLGLNDNLIVEEILKSIERGQVQGQGKVTMKVLGSTPWRREDNRSEAAYSVEIEFCDPALGKQLVVEGSDRRKNSKLSGDGDFSAKPNESNGKGECAGHPDPQKKDCKSIQDDFSIVNRSWENSPQLDPDRKIFSSGSDSSSRSRCKCGNQMKDIDQIRGRKKRPNFRNRRLSVGRESEDAFHSSGLKGARLEKEVSKEDWQCATRESPSQVRDRNGNEENDPARFNYMSTEVIADAGDPRLRGRRSSRPRKEKALGRQIKGTRAIKSPDRPQVESWGRTESHTNCFCVGSRKTHDSNSQESESLTATSGREAEEDTSDADSPSPETYNRGLEEPDVREVSDESRKEEISGGKDGCNVSDIYTDSRENDVNGISNFGVKRARRAEWNVEKFATESTIFGVENENSCEYIHILKSQGRNDPEPPVSLPTDETLPAAESSNYQSSYPNVHPRDSFKMYSFSKTSICDEDAIESPESKFDFQLPMSDVDYMHSTPIEDNLHVEEPGSTFSDSNNSRTYRNPWVSGSCLQQTARIGVHKDGWLTPKSVHENCVRRKRPDEVIENHQRPGNKWLRRIVRFPVPQEAGDFGTQDYDRQFQHASNTRSTSSFEVNEDCCIDNDQKEMVCSRYSADFKHEHYVGVMPSDQHNQSNGILSQGSNSCYPQDEASLLGECPPTGDMLNGMESTEVEAQAWSSSPAKLFRDLDSVSQCLEASESLLHQKAPRKHQCEYGGCCHVQSRYCTEETLLSYDKAEQLRGHPFCVKKGSPPVFPSMGSMKDWRKAPNSLSKATTGRASRVGQDEGFKDCRDNYEWVFHDGSLNSNTSTSVHRAGPRIKTTPIAGAIISSTRGIYREAETTASCQHVFLNVDYKPEYKYPDDLRKRRKERLENGADSSWVNDPRGRTGSCNFSKNYGFQDNGHQICCNDIDNLKTRESNWEHYGKRYEEMLNQLKTRCLKVTGRKNITRGGSGSGGMDEEVQEHISPSKLSLSDIDDPNRRESDWKNWQHCEKRYHAVMKEFKNRSAQAVSHEKRVEGGVDINEVDDIIQEHLSQSGHDKDIGSLAKQSKQSARRCVCRNAHQEGESVSGPSERSGTAVTVRAARKIIFSTKTLKRIFNKNESDDSSSDDDLYDQASRKFRDQLFKRFPRKNNQHLCSAGQQIPRSGDSKVYLELDTRRKIKDIQKQLRSLTSCDNFKISSVCEELLRIKQEMKEVSRAFDKKVHHEQKDRPKRNKLSGNLRYAQQLREGTGSVSETADGSDHVDNSEVDEGHPLALELKSASHPKHPLWSKWMGNKTASCGGPISVTMAVRLTEAEVPVAFENGFKVQYVPVEERGLIGMRDKPQRWLTREKRERLRVIAENLKNPEQIAVLSSAFCAMEEVDDSRKSQNLQPSQYPIYFQDDDSSSTSTWSELLYLKHGKEPNETDISIRKQKTGAEDSDSARSSFPSEFGTENLETFLSEAEQQLTKLQLAKVQLDQLSPESLARVGTFCKDSIPETSGRSNACLCITDTNGSESAFPEEREETDVKRKRNKPLIPKSKNPRKLTAPEIKEFDLLERRVQRELGGAVRNAAVAKSKQGRLQAQEDISDPSKRTDVGTPVEEVYILDQDHSNDSGDSSKLELETSVSDAFEFEKASSTKGQHGPVSSLVKLYFGSRKEEPSIDKGISGEKFQDISTAICQKVELLESEILYFTRENKRIKATLKEQDEQAARFKQEKAAWEQQKASDVEALTQLREAEISKLRKERSKLEQQARAAPPKFSKEERKGADDLKAKLAQEQDNHRKKELQWRLTGNRLREANRDLLEQIYELRKEIGRYEEQILLQMDTQESAIDTSAQSSKEGAKVRRRTEQIKSRFNNGILTTGSHVKDSMRNLENIIMSEKNPRASNQGIVRTCEEATTMLTRRMKYLEKDVESWIHIHPQESQREE